MGNPPPNKCYTVAYTRNPKGCEGMLKKCVADRKIGCAFLNKEILEKDMNGVWVMNHEPVRWMKYSQMSIPEYTFPCCGFI